jgi:hypothetical protein
MDRTEIQKLVIDAVTNNPKTENMLIKLIKGLDLSDMDRSSGEIIEEALNVAGITTHRELALKLSYLLSDEVEIMTVLDCGLRSPVVLIRNMSKPWPWCFEFHFVNTSPFVSCMNDLERWAYGGVFDDNPHWHRIHNLGNALAHPILWETHKTRFIKKVCCECCKRKFIPIYPLLSSAQHKVGFGNYIGYFCSEGCKQTIDEMVCENCEINFHWSGVDAVHFGGHFCRRCFEKLYQDGDERVQLAFMGTPA